MLRLAIKWNSLRDMRDMGMQQMDPFIQASGVSLLMFKRAQAASGKLAVLSTRGQSYSNELYFLTHFN